MKENLSGTLAIDLGNTNTVVAFQDEKDINSVLVEIPNITKSPGVVPTAVWFEAPTKILKIGISAQRMRGNSNSNLFFHSNFKRLIGNPIEKFNKKNILIILLKTFLSSISDLTKTSPEGKIIPDIPLLAL